MAKYNNNIDVINLIGVELFKLFETKKLIDNSLTVSENVIHSTFNLL